MSVNPEAWEGLWRYFADKLSLLIATAAREGLVVDLHSGFRSFEEQERLYGLGRTIPNRDGKAPDKPMGNTVTKARGGDSWHNYGLAADLVFLDSKGKWTWDDNLPWRKLGILGMECGLEWGGNWEAMPDRPHFQLRGGLTIREAKVIGAKDKVWKEVAKRIALARDVG